MKKVLKNVHKYKISKGADGRWETYIPDTSKATGRRLIKRNDKKDLYCFLITFYHLAESGCAMIFAELFEEWINYKRQFVSASNRRRSLSPSTIRRYERDYDRYIKGTKLDSTLISDLSGPKLEMMIRDIIKKNAMSENNADNLISYIRQAFSYAKRCQYVTADPAELIDRVLLLSACEFIPPKADTERVLTVKELRSLLKETHVQQEKHPTYMPNYAIELAILTGMRVGEIAALKWSCIGENYINIDFSEHRLDYKDRSCELIIGEPKNGKHREIQITEEIRELFDRIKMADSYSMKDGFVFLREDGTRYTAHDISCAIKRRAAEAGIKNTSIHGIRRTVSSLLNTVLPQKVVADMLGHSERVNEKHYNFSIAESEEKKRAIEEMYSKVFGLEDYVSKDKKTGSA